MKTEAFGTAWPSAFLTVPTRSSRLVLAITAEGAAKIEAIATAAQAGRSQEKERLAFTGKTYHRKCIRKNGNETSGPANPVEAVRVIRPLRIAEINHPVR